MPEQDAQHAAEEPREGVPEPVQEDELAPDLSGDLGTSSERTDPQEGVQGTGTMASAQGRTDGATPTHPDDDVPQVRRDEPGIADQGAEPQPDNDVPSHVSDPARNPGHSHG
jgi:hypothetical protein